MFINVIVPVMIVMFVGYLFGRNRNIDHAPISKFAMMVLSPALIFSFLVRNPLSSNEMVQIIVSSLAFLLIMIVIVVVLFRILKKQHLLAATLLSVGFPNSGNFGLPVLLLAYGEEAFSIGVVIVVIHFMFMYSVGIYIATLGNSNWRKSLIDILRLPTTYATVAAILINITNIEIPDFLYHPIKLMGDAAVPVVLLILGIQLARTTIKGSIGVTLIATALKTLFAPIIIFFIVFFMGIEGTMAKVIILQHAMPTAVIMTMIAAEYKARTEVVANVTLLSSILSIFSITVILILLDFYYG